MFTENTVFILGAGASWHYGYPTGEELVKKVINKAKEYADALALNVTHSYRKEYGDYSVKIYDKEIPKFQYNKERDAIRNNCYLLASRLKAANTLVIDDFLSMQEEGIQEIGKFLIAWVILECEGHYLPRLTRNKSNNYNRNRELESQKDNKALGEFNDDWCRFVLHEIVYGCKKSSDEFDAPNKKTLLANKVKFITFNYDVSLEQMLFRGLVAHSDFFSLNEIEQFFSNDRFIHMYGQVCEKPIQNFDPFITDWSNDKNPEFDRIYESSQQIKTIEGIGKQNDVAESKAKLAIKNAERVFILGFGFDDRNCERLELESLPVTGRCKRVSFTNYGDSDRINKKVNKLFDLGHYFYRGGNNFVTRMATMANLDPTSFERSTVDVYRALAEDFEF